MKRPRSYGEGLDDDAGEKGVFKDWTRRDPDSDRPPSSSSSHRRFYPKLDTGRKGSSSSSYDRLLDDDREPLLPRPVRKRFDHDLDFDRRKGGGAGGGGFDRYRVLSSAGDRSAQASSPRVGYSGGDRMRRSESFSLSSRREFAKGFRSERERSRREGSSGSSWHRSSSSIKEFAADDEVRSPASVGRSVSPAAGSLRPMSPATGSVGRGSRVVLEERGSRVVREERGKSRSKDSSSGGEPTRSIEPTRSVEVKKPVEKQKERSSGSDMEEGELEPEQEPVQQLKPEPSPPATIEQCPDTEAKGGNGLEESSQSETKTLSDEKLHHDDEDASSAKGEDFVSESIKETNELHNHEIISQDQIVKKDIKDEEVIREAEVVAAAANRGQETEDCQPAREAENQRKDQVVEEDSAAASAPAFPCLKGDMENKQTATGVVDLRSDKDIIDKEERNDDPRHGHVEGKKCIDLEGESEHPGGEFTLESNKNNNVTLGLMTGTYMDSCRDKGKSLATSLSNDANSMEDNDTMEGPSSRGFELVFHSVAMRPDKVNAGGIVIGKRKDERPKLEPLDLSLSLPGVSSDLPVQNLNPKTNSPRRARSIQSLASSFRTNSDDFTTSISLSGSQTFVHNPSCSLTHNSMENFEQSVGSRPLFQGIDQNSNPTVWQGQPSNEPKQKGEEVPLYQKFFLNGNATHHSSDATSEKPFSKSNGMLHQICPPKHLYSTQSFGSHETQPEHNKENKVLTRERSSSLFRSEQRDSEQSVLNSIGVEKIFAKIVSEPLQLIGRRIQEMTEQSVSYMKEAIRDLLVNKDKLGELNGLQEILQRRSELTLETLSQSHRVLLEILVSIKTGLPDFLFRSNDAPSSDLAEIFLNLKCRNLACKTSLPVDECDCKVCSQKNGFCSQCMCLICSKFDTASNTCSWVGCDVCLHWCHTDCGLRDSRIRNGISLTGAHGTTEMQFHCVACDHPSEMFGFVKEVFKACVKDWNAETLAKELEYVSRIFSASDDARGRQLHDVANQLLLKLKNKTNPSEVSRCIMEFLAESESNFNKKPSTFSSKEVPMKNLDRSNGPIGGSNGPIGGSNIVVGSSKELTWLPSFPTERSPHQEITGSILPSLANDRIGRWPVEVELQRSLEKKPVVDELENVVKFKLAEAKMYQSRADDARREADGLQRIAIAKNEKIDEEYSSRIGKLRIYEAEERRRQKVEEHQILERAQREYFSMKMRMEADIKNLLLKMEAMKHNLNT